MVAQAYAGSQIGNLAVRLLVLIFSLWLAAWVVGLKIAEDHEPSAACNTPTDFLHSLLGIMVEVKVSYGDMLLHAT
jgi:hypothetical protein